MKMRAANFDKTAISPYDQYCDGYSRPGSMGLGYISVVKVATGVVEKTDDALLDGIVAYDRAEANDAYIGQINMETASSFCGIAGQVWGYDIATADEIANGTEKPIPGLDIVQYDGSPLPVYDAQPIMDAGIALFGTENQRHFPPAPGAHVICANKSTTNYLPRNGVIDKSNPDEAYGVWCFIALSITRNRNNSADLFIEDAGTWTTNKNASDLKAFLDEHRKQVMWSIVACGKDQSVTYNRTYISYAYAMMDPGFVGTALTVAPYITLARQAVPPTGFASLNNMTLSQWKSSIGLD